MLNTVFMAVANSGTHASQITDNHFINTATNVAVNATWEEALEFDGDNENEEVTCNVFGNNHFIGIKLTSQLLVVPKM